MVEGAWVHSSKLDPFLGFYPEQIEALKALWKAIHGATDIPYEAPLKQNGNTETKYVQDVAYGSFSGFVRHYHISKGKIDCAGLDIRALLDEIENEE